MSSQTVRVGIAGLGRISDSHIAGFQAAPGAEIVAVCDTDRGALDRVSRSLGVRPHSNMNELFADPSVDAVSLLLPHDLHYSAAKRALEAGKHVCMEKPMAVTEAQCTELIGLASEHKRVLSVTQNTRFALAHVAAKNLLDAGELGAVHLVRVAMIGNEVDGYRSQEPRDAWRRRANGIGALIDAASHYFYLLHWLVGDISSVRAIGRNALPGLEVEDYALTSGSFAGGGWFSVEVDLTAEITWQERLEIHGTSGSLIIDHEQNPPAVLFKGWESPSGTPLQTVPYDPVGWRDASIAAAIDDFVQAVREDRPPVVNVQDAAYSVKVVQRAMESIAAGGTLLDV